MDKYVVGLAGAHGTGKSTILKAIKASGHAVDESQLSREAQRALGWENLSRAQESQDDMWELQDAILDAMDVRDRRIQESKRVTLVDRTPADVYGYVQLWISRLGEENINQSKRRRYFNRLYDLAERYRCQIIVPIRNEIPFVAESNRADEASRIFHAEEVRHFIQSMNYPHSCIHSVNLDMRVIEVKQRLREGRF